MTAFCVLSWKGSKSICECCGGTDGPGKGLRALLPSMGAKESSVLGHAGGSRWRCRSWNKLTVLCVCFRGYYGLGVILLIMKSFLGHLFKRGKCTSGHSAALLLLCFFPHFAYITFIWGQLFSLKHKHLSQIQNLFLFSPHD